MFLLFRKDDVCEEAQSTAVNFVSFRIVDGYGSFFQEPILHEVSQLSSCTGFLIRRIPSS